MLRLLVQREQVLRRLDLVEAPPPGVHDRVNGAVIGLGGLAEVEAAGDAHHHVALVAVLFLVVVEEGVAAEAETLWIPGVLDRDAEVAGEQLGKLVLVALLVAVRHRHAVGIGAYAEGLAVGRARRRRGRRQQPEQPERPRPPP
ncbi:MAG: hypothetical protein GWO02_18680 [Gammaproteobacteria bacterium]|nr:hypothetical protein [Gammaproteobacteria bacterium]